MSAIYVIDGYNLLHAMGVLGGRAGPHGLEKARTRLLNLLHGALGEETHAVTVVFDAAKALPGIAAEQEYQGMRVVFATGKEEADDVIERLIRQSSSPKALQVVSDDHRVQQAAKRRGSQARGCEEFLAWLDKHRRKRQVVAAEAPEKKDQLSDSEIRRWLAEFDGLEADPALKQAFESYEFEKGEMTD
ncbi:MAG TPA: NYN domain-containing protein [Gemmataceae bacterium]|nr:NYN domain-containing protein [Gemmataceae bacterium]